MKKLYRSRTNRHLAGVCGGLGDYYNVDATIIRVALIVLILVTGVFPGVVAYLIAIFVIPSEPLQ